VETILCCQACCACTHITCAPSWILFFWGGGVVPLFIRAWFRHHLLGLFSFVRSVRIGENVLLCMSLPVIGARVQEHQLP
jgi:hypothetical protein